MLMGLSVAVVAVSSSSGDGGHRRSSSLLNLTVRWLNEEAQ